VLRFLLVEAAQVTVRSVPEWRSKYLHLMMRRGRKTAKVAMARRLAVRLCWMWRKGLGLRAGENVRFARGTARTSRWCAVKHRVIDWASRYLHRGVRSVIAIRGRRDAWIGPWLNSFARGSWTDLCDQHDKGCCDRSLVTMNHFVLSHDRSVLTSNPFLPSLCYVCRGNEESHRRTRFGFRKQEYDQEHQ
jgi:hypothetical protein